MMPGVVCKGGDMKAAAAVLRDGVVADVRDTAKLEAVWRQVHALRAAFVVVHMRLFFAQTLAKTDAPGFARRRKNVSHAHSIASCVAQCD